MYAYTQAPVLDITENLEHINLEKYKGRFLQQIATSQLGSKQDHVAHGRYVDGTGKDVFWSLASDGHGGHEIIRTIRKLDLNEIMKTNAPYAELQTKLLETCRDLHSGATLVYTKITAHDTHFDIQIVNIGDSRAVLFVDGKKIFVSQLHNFNNGKEMVRLMISKKVDPIEPISYQARSFDVLSLTSLVSKGGAYVNFLDPMGGKNITLTPTQSLGHVGLTGIEPTITNFRVSLTSSFKVVLFSDGVDDVLPADEGIFLSLFRNSSAADILAIAERNWKQKWTCYSAVGAEGIDLTKSTVASFPTRNGYDDCCCAVLEFEAIPPSREPVYASLYIPPFEDTPAVAADQTEEDDDVDSLYN